MSDDYNATKNNLRLLRSNASNLLILLEMASNNRDTSEILERMTPSIHNHFDRVEALDVIIPEENKREHRRLWKYTEEMESSWRKRKLSHIDYADALNFNLYNHFSTYFKALLNRELGEGSTLDFRL